MASSPGDLPPREQLELFVQSGQGATQLEIAMAKKSKKAAKKGPLEVAAPKKKKGKAVAEDSVNEGTGTADGDDAMTASADDGGKKGKGKGKGKRGGGGGGGAGGGGGMGGGGMGSPGMMDTSLEAEARRRYLNYALSVITRRPQAGAAPHPLFDVARQPSPARRQASQEREGHRRRDG
jgi:hypothetical protein